MRRRNFKPAAWLYFDMLIFCAFMSCMQAPFILPLLMSMLAMAISLLASVARSPGAVSLPCGKILEGRADWELGAVYFGRPEMLPVAVSESQAARPRPGVWHL